LTTDENARFRSDASKLISGTVVSQGIAIASVPILAWFFDPDAFGLAAVFTSIVLITGVVACLRYELALLLPERDEEACNLLAACLAFPILVAALLVPAVLWMRQPLAEYWEQPALAQLLWMLPIAILFHGWFTALSYWQTRNRRYVNQSIAKTTATFSQASGAIAAGGLGHSSGTTLIVFQLMGQALSIIVLGLTTWQRDIHKFARAVHPRAIYQQVVRYRKFPMVDTWSELLNIASYNMPVLLLGYFFPITVVGHYSLGHRLLNIPMSLVGRSMSQVFFQNATVAHRESRLGNLVSETSAYLLQLSFFPFLMITIVGTDMFTVVFGTKWATAGLYAQILAPWLLFQFLYVPMSNLLNVLQLQEMGLFLSVLLFASRVAALVYGGVLGEPIVSLLWFSISGCLLYGAFFAYVLRKAGVLMLPTLAQLVGSQKINLVLVSVLLLAKVSGYFNPLMMVGLATGLTAVFAPQVVPLPKLVALGRRLATRSAK
jgi:lipopolysaccharide exporter